MRPLLNSVRRVAVLSSGAATIAPPAITYGGSPFTWPQYDAITPASPTNTGGAADSYAVVSGSLPTGVTLNTTTGQLSGTPTAADESSPITIRATNAGGTGDAVITVSVTAFDPYTSISNCVQGLDFSDISTLYQDSGKTTAVSADNDPIGAAVDQSGNGNDALQTTVGMRPTYKTSIQNSLSVARGDGSDDKMAFTVAPTSSATVVIVCSWPSRSNIYIWDDANVHDVIGNFTAGRAETYSKPRSTIQSSITNGTWHIITVRAVDSGGAHECWFDGSKTVDNTTTGDWTTIRNIWGASSANCGDNDIGEFLVYDDAISDADLLKLHTHLQAKWNTPALP